MTQQVKIKRRSKRIPTHYGMTDYYTYYKENSDNPVSKREFNNVIKQFNDEVVHQILYNYKVYTVPLLRLKINIRKAKPKIKFKNGVVVNGNPVDWVTTNKLWETNADAKEKKVLVRFTNRHTFGYVFKVQALKFQARFKNKAFFRFKPSRRFQRSLSKRINDKDSGVFDSYLLYE